MAKFTSGLQSQFELWNGCRIELVLGVNDTKEKFLRDSNLPVPLTVKIIALIDTGATASCIDTRYINQLSLETSGYVRCKTAWGVRFPPVCTVKLTLPLDPDPWVSKNHRCAAFDNLSVGEEGALIGLDVLRHFQFIVDGPKSHFKLMLPEVDGEPPETLANDGISYYDYQSDCFQRLENGAWKSYTHIPEQKGKPGFLSRMKDKFR
jgi:hypothetical protein